MEQDLPADVRGGNDADGAGKQLIFGPLRSVPMGVRVVTGISFGFVFYVLDQIFGPLTLVYGIPPIIGALLPSASFFLISLWLLLKRS